MEERNETIDLKELETLKESIGAKRVDGTLSFHADELKTYPDNPRSEFTGLEDIRASMLSDGYLPTAPVEVDLDTMEVPSGNTRLLAAQGLSDEWKANNKILAVGYRGLTELEKKIIAIEGNERRYGLSFYDTCRHIVRLVDDVCLSMRSIETLMSRNGGNKGKSQINNYYRYGKGLAPEVLRAVDTRHIRQNMAALLARTGSGGRPLYTHQEQVSIVEAIKQRGIGAQQFTRYLTSYRRKRVRELNDRTKSNSELGDIDVLNAKLWDSMMSDEVQRLQREKSIQIVSNIVATALKHDDENYMGPYINRTLQSAQKKELDISYTRECIKKAAAAMDQAFAKLNEFICSVVEDTEATFPEGSDTNVVEEQTKDEDVYETEPPLLPPAKRVSSKTKREQVSYEILATKQ